MNTFDLPSFMSIADKSTDELRSLALSRTRTVLQELWKLHRALELPPSEFRTTVDIFGQVIVSLAIDNDRMFTDANKMPEPVTMRIPMPIVSCDGDRGPTALQAGRIYTVTTRPQWVAYRVEEIEIEDHPERWLVHDIRVGHRSQLASRHQPIPGEAFRKGGLMGTLKLDTCQTAMDFVLEVEYIGPEKDGEIFRAAAVGTAVT